MGADTINIHGGGAYENKESALLALHKSVANLPEPVRSRLTLENEDKVYPPADLLPVCENLNMPLVYDVHHHRCLQDNLSIAEETEKARNTWTTEPLFHISSPLEGWDGPKPHRHHDYIAVEDSPPSWMGWPLTVEVEAKAKERAVTKILEDLKGLKSSQLKPRQLREASPYPASRSKYGTPAIGNCHSHPNETNEWCLPRSRKIT